MAVSLDANAVPPVIAKVMQLAPGESITVRGDELWVRAYVTEIRKTMFRLECNKFWRGHDLLFLIKRPPA